MALCTPSCRTSVEIEVDLTGPRQLRPDEHAAAGETAFAVGTTIRANAPRCNPWKWFGLGLLALVLLGLLTWGLVSFASGPRAAVASATMAPAMFAQAGGQPPVSATASTGSITIYAGGQPAMQVPAKSAAPAASAPSKVPTTCNCKAVVFNTKAYHAFGVEVAREGANFAFSQTAGELASPNDLLVAQAAKKEWITVFFDPSGPYAVNHKGMSIPVTMDNSGRILVPVSQTQV